MFTASTAFDLPLSLLAVTSPNNITVVCNKTLGDGWLTDFTVNFAAVAGVTGCADRKEVAVPVKRNQLPTVTVTGPSTKDVCANSGTASLTYNIDSEANGAAAWNLAITSTGQGVSCNASQTSGTGEPH